MARVGRTDTGGRAEERVRGVEERKQKTDGPNERQGTRNRGETTEEDRRRERSRGALERGTERGREGNRGWGASEIDLPRQTDEYGD